MEIKQTASNLMTAESSYPILQSDQDNNNPETYRWESMIELFVPTEGQNSPSLKLFLYPSQILKTRELEACKID
jgi:hypothetical protein